jgi:CO/xanthine dehydrogenase FAD-binding subunit
MLNIRAYHRPKQLDEAISLLNDPDAGRTVIAGGTDLLVNPRYMAGVREIVDLRDLGLALIAGPEDGAAAGMLIIGACATMRQVALSPLIQRLASGILARSAAVTASPNIRNMATLGGNTASALPSADTPPTLLALDALVVLAGPPPLPGEPHAARHLPLEAGPPVPPRPREHAAVSARRLPVSLSPAQSPHRARPALRRH